MSKLTEWQRINLSLQNEKESLSLSSLFFYISSKDKVYSSICQSRNFCQNVTETGLLARSQKSLVVLDAATTEVNLPTFLWFEILPPAELKGQFLKNRVHV